MANDNTNFFMEMIQNHERAWGMEQYTGRPSLEQLLKAPIVAVWSDKPDDPRKTALRNASGAEEKFILTAHESPAGLNTMLTEVVILGRGASASRRRLSRVFVKQKLAEIVGVKLIIKDESE